MIIVDFINNLSLLIALSVISGIINSKFSNTKISLKIFQGFLFGITSIVGMLHPFVFQQGIFFDGRTIIISICTLFFGPISGLISAVINLSYRLYLGGDGVRMAIAIVIVAFVVGYIFYRYEKSKAHEYISTKRLFLMGFIVHLGMMGFIFLLPSNFVLEAIHKIALSVLLIFPFVSTLIGKILISLQQNKDYITKITRREKFFRTTLYSIGDGVIITDQHGLIKNMNHNAVQLTGWEETDAKGKHLSEVFKIISEITNEETFNPVEQVLQNGQTIGLANHTLLINKNGSKIPIADSAAPITDESNNITGVVLVFRDQSEEKLQQKIVTESNEKFSKIFDSTSNAISLSTFETGKIVDINNAFISLFGHSKDEAIGKTTLELGIWDNPDDRLQLLSLLNENRKIKNIEMIGRSKDGNRIIGLVSADLIQIDHTKMILLNIHNITERKESEIALKESKMQTEAFLKAIPDMIFLIGKTGEFLDYRGVAEYQRIFGSGNLVGKHIRDVATKEIATITLQKMIELFATNKPQIFEFQYERNGNLFIFENRLVNFGENAVLSIVRDITDKIQTEKNIRKLSLAVEQSTANIIITDIQGRIEYVNKNFTEITGYTLEEVKGKNPDILAYDINNNANYQNISNLLLSNQEWRGEFYNKKKNGETYWVSAVISPVQDSLGQIINFVAIEEDITEQKRLTQELIEAKEKAEEMNKIKSYFFANMSHELRTPFIGILGFSELLADLVLDPELRTYAEQIQKSSKRLTETLNKILDVTRIEFDKIEPKLVDLSASQIIKDTIELYNLSAKSNNTIIKTSFKQNDTIISTDKKLFEEIVMNLISNAVKFTKNGTIELSCQNLIFNDKKIFEIKVADTGVGIPKSKHDVIWREFRQVSEGFNRSFEGTGLGLTITKKYVEILGGTISLQSDEGKGSVFTVQLPNHHKDIDELQKNSTSGNIGIEEKKNSTNQSLSILYVEDDITTSNYLKIVFKNKYKIDTAHNAFVAYEKVQRHKFDILLLDINLGSGMNGVELMQKIKELKEYNNVPIIAVTAYAAESDKAEFLKKGFSHYIAKPFTREQIISFLENVVVNR
jgi:PAS domain S-box-containing protein